MNDKMLAVRRLFESIYERTDMMYNALCVDEFDVFESNLDLREQLINEFLLLKAELEASELVELNSEKFFTEISHLDKRIQQELLRYQNDTKKAFSELQKEKNALESNQKKTNQYHFITESTLSGNLFDKKK